MASEPDPALFPMTNVWPIVPRCFTKIEGSGEPNLHLFASQDSSSRSGSQGLVFSRRYDTQTRSIRCRETESSRFASGDTFAIGRMPPQRSLPGSDGGQPWKDWPDSRYGKWGRPEEPIGRSAGTRRLREEYRGSPLPLAFSPSLSLRQDFPYGLEEAISIPPQVCRFISSDTVTVK